MATYFPLFNTFPLISIPMLSIGILRIIAEDRMKIRKKQKEALARGLLKFIEEL